jgi:hypothetical protein
VESVGKGDESLRRRSFLFVLLFIALLFHSGALSSAAPKIELGERVYSFNEMIEGATVEHVYQVQNRGDQPLEIQRIKPG